MADKTVLSDEDRKRVDTFLEDTLKRLEESERNGANEKAQIAFKDIRDKLIPALGEEEKKKWQAYDLDNTPDAASARSGLSKSVERLESLDEVKEFTSKELNEKVASVANGVIERSDKEVIKLANEAGIDGQKYVDRLAENRSYKDNKVWMDKESQKLAANKDITVDAAKAQLAALNKEATKIYQNATIEVDRLSKTVSNEVVRNVSERSTPDVTKEVTRPERQERGL